jgi:phosphotriesterase-related protein
MAALITTLGPRRAEELGLILPHEHIFANFDGLDLTPAWRVAKDDVLELLAQPIADAKAAGVSVLVEATSLGGGRRADILLAVSQGLGIPIVAATGIFREPWIGEYVRRHGEALLAQWMELEIADGIDGGPLHAGWIKLRSGDERLTEEQTVLLTAAARAAGVTGVAIGSHTVAGKVAEHQVDVVERSGYRADRFIWIHAQVENDFAWNVKLAQRGAWIEYDGIGDSPGDDVYIKRILRLWDAGYGERILLSQDRGWYDPLKPGGGVPKPYTYLPQVFLPKLLDAGLTQAAIEQMTIHNPFQAYATDYEIRY